MIRENCASTSPAFFHESVFHSSRALDQNVPLSFRNLNTIFRESPSRRKAAILGAPSLLGMLDSLFHDSSPQQSCVDDSVMTPKYHNQLLQNKMRRNDARAGLGRHSRSVNTQRVPVLGLQTPKHIM